MLWAQFQPRNKPEAIGFVIGIIIAVVISGAIPIIVGFVCQKIPLGLIGGVVSGGTAILLGCLGGLPMALLFSVGIIIWTCTSHDRRRSPVELDYDDDYDRPRRRRRRPRYDESEDDRDFDRRRRRYDDEPRAYRRLDEIEDEEEHGRRRRRPDIDD
jgi:hypothetical protein